MSKKNMINIMLSLSISVFMPFSVLASPEDITNSNLPVISNSIQNPYEDIKSQLEDQIMKKDNEIEKSLLNLKQNTQKVQNLKSNISENEKSLKDLNLQMYKTSENSSKSIKKLYIDTSNNLYIQIILSSKNLNDFLEKAYFVNQFVKYNLDSVNELKKNKKDIQKKLTQLKKDKIDYEKFSSNITKQITFLNTQKDNENKLLTSLKEYSEKFGQNSSTALLSQQQTSEILNKNLDINSDVINYSVKFLGVPYVWGGTSPEGFDCSGFVQYVYAHFGISLPRTSQEQQNVGIQILNRQNLEPGDLIFFGNPAYHVGMYVGNNYFIEAPKTGDVVKLAPLYNYTSAARVR